MNSLKLAPFRSDTVNLYGVTTKRLNEQVRRNFDRFLKDFMFQLDENELVAMRSQIATASKRYIRFLSYAEEKRARQILDAP